MEVKLLLSGIALAIWAVLMRHLSRKFTFPLSIALFPLGIISVMIYVLIKNRAFTAILLVFALAVIIYLYIKWVKDKKQDELFNEIYDWIKTIDIAIFLGVIIMTFVVQSFAIPSGSMKNTFLEGDRLFVNKFIYGVRIPVIGKIIIPVNKPRRGDKVVFWPPMDSKFPFIKRCMGIPGDKLQVINKQLYVNEELQDEPYVIHSDPVIYSSANSLALSQVIRDNFGPIIVSSGCYFMMGDNRDESYDSRYWGIVQEKNIRGKAMFTYWPPVRIGIPK